MNEIYEMEDFLPISIPELTLSKYIDHHLSHFYKCLENNLFTSGYSHLHILYMLFVYIQLLRISKEKEQEFKLCWIGFPTEEKDFLDNSSSPFSFSRIKEKTVFRFFKLVGFDDGTIGDISSLVNKRNNHLHASGEIFFESEESFLKEVERYFKKMQKIIDKQDDFLKTIYLAVSNEFPDEYQITEDDLENSFGIPYFFSKYELRHFAKDNDNLVSRFINEDF